MCYAARLASPALALATALSLPAQTTYVVDPSGSGSFTTIPAALAVAQPGDIVLVRAGIYPTFGVSTGIRLLGDPGAMIASPGTSAVSARDLPVGQTLVVRGFSFLPSVYPRNLTVTDCSGHVHLEQMNLAVGLTVERSSQVSLYDVSIRGFPPADITDSTVAFADCQITSEKIVFRYANALDAVRSHVLCSHTTITGGDDIVGFLGGGVALHMTDSTVTLVGTGSVVAAGASLSGVPVPAVRSIGGTLIADPSVQLTPTGGAAPVAGTATVLIRSTPAVFGDVQASVLSSTLEAPAGATSSLVLGIPLQPSVALPFGNLWIGPAHVVLDRNTVIPASGQHTVTLNLPPLAPGIVLLLQAVVLNGGLLQLSNPVLLTLDG